jgi:Regulator of chromosome condensation (RCC1) repeat
VSAAHITFLTVFFQIEVLKGVEICQVAAGNAHALALLRNLTGVYAWGRSDFGQAGRATTGEHFVSTPTLVLFDGFTPSCRITDIAAGSEHSLAMTDNGVVYVWGNNDHGQLGLRSVNKIYTPKKLEMKTGSYPHRPLKVIQMVGGLDKTLFLVAPCECGHIRVTEVPPAARVPGQSASSTGAGASGSTNTTGGASVACSGEAAPSTSASTAGGVDSGTTANTTTTSTGTPSSLGASPSGAPPLFGAPAPAPTGFFGGSTFAATLSASTATSADTGVVNTPGTSTSLFGTAQDPPAGGNAGSADPPTAAPYSLFGATAAPLPQNRPTGTGGGTLNTPFSPTSRQDGTSAIQLQSITAMASYEGDSFEELRLQDSMSVGRGSATTGDSNAPSTIAGVTESGFIFGRSAATTGSMIGRTQEPAFALGFGPAPAPPALVFGGSPEPPVGSTAARTFSFGLFGSSLSAPGTLGATDTSTSLGAPTPTEGMVGSLPAPNPAFTLGRYTSTVDQVRVRARQPVRRPRERD